MLCIFNETRGKYGVILWTVLARQEWFCFCNSTLCMQNIRLHIWTICVKKTGLHLSVHVLTLHVYQSYICDRSARGM